MVERTCNFDFKACFDSLTLALFSKTRLEYESEPNISTC